MNDITIVDKGSEQMVQDIMRINNKIIVLKAENEKLQNKIANIKKNIESCHNHMNSKRLKDDWTVIEWFKDNIDNIINENHIELPIDNNVTQPSNANTPIVWQTHVAITDCSKV